MEKIKIYILEDEIITQELLKETLESMDYEVCGMHTNAEKSLQEIQKLQPDIAILDIRVDGDKSGIWLGDQLDFPIIYLTAFNDKKTIKQAIRTKPIGYLPKPFNATDLFIAVELALSKISNRHEIIVKERNRNIKVQIDDVLYAKKDDHYLILHLKDSKKVIRSSVKEFLELIQSRDFIQVHRSYIINKNYVSEFNTKEIIIRGDKIPISQSFVKEVIKELT